MVYANKQGILYSGYTPLLRSLNEYYLQPYFINVNSFITHKT